MTPPTFTLDKVPAVMADAKRWFTVAIEWDVHRGKWSKQPRCKWSDEGQPSHTRERARLRRVHLAHARTSGDALGAFS